MKVLKFGGSSLATPKRIRDVGRIVVAAARRESLMVVVSAFQGITNELLECARIAEQGDDSYQALWKKIAKRHHSSVDELLGKKPRVKIRAEVDGCCRSCTTRCMEFSY